MQSEFKLIFCGDATVGKTSLIHRICFDSYQGDPGRTQQIDTYKKRVVATGGQSTVNLSIWDTLGQERFVFYSFVYTLFLSLFLLRFLLNLNSFEALTEIAVKFHFGSFVC